MTFVYPFPKSERKGSEICSKAKFIRRVSSAWLWMKSIVLPNGAVQATTRSFSFSSFSCVIFVTRNFNYAILTQGDLRHQYGISGGKSSRFARSSGSE